MKMYPARSQVAGSSIVPSYANVPMKGGKAPTTAPTRVLYSLFCFIGKYIVRYENQIVLEMTQVKGSKAWNAKREPTVSPVPRKHACFEEILPLAIGLFFVLVIFASCSASFT